MLFSSRSVGPLPPPTMSIRRGPAYCSQASSGFCFKSSSFFPKFFVFAVDDWSVSLQKSCNHYRPHIHVRTASSVRTAAFSRQSTSPENPVNFREEKQNASKATLKEDVKQALKSKSRQAKRWLGQHYMVNEAVNKQITEIAGIHPGDVVLEIGPGTGALTSALTAAGAYVIAVDKDADMVDLMRKRFGASGQVEVVHADFLKWRVGDMAALLRQAHTRNNNHCAGSGGGGGGGGEAAAHLQEEEEEEEQERPGAEEDEEEEDTLAAAASSSSAGRGCREGDDDRWSCRGGGGGDGERLSCRGETRAKVVSNLPFNVTTDVLQRLLPLEDLFSDVTLMLQAEAAERLVCASPGRPDYRAINVLVRFFSRPELRLRVGRQDFFPRPNVDAAVVRFDLQRAVATEPRGGGGGEELLLSTRAGERAVLSVVRSAFRSKRQLLRNTLQHLHADGRSGIDTTLAKLGLAPDRAKGLDLTMEEFVALTLALEEDRQNVNGSGN